MVGWALAGAIPGDPQHGGAGARKAGHPGDAEAPRAGALCRTAAAAALHRLRPAGGRAGSLRPAS